MNYGIETPIFALLLPSAESAGQKVTFQKMSRLKFLAAKAVVVRFVQWTKYPCQNDHLFGKMLS